MKADAVLYFLAQFKYWRHRIAEALRGTWIWGPLRAVYRIFSPCWRNSFVRSVVNNVTRRHYQANPRAHWEVWGGKKYIQNEAFLLGPGSLTEHQGQFLAGEIQALGATSVLEVGCGYGRILKEIGKWLDVCLVGTDFSESQLVAARQYLAPRTIPLVLSDATQGLPFKNDAFDVVCTQGSLMHVPPPMDFAYRSELARVARRYVIHTEDVQDVGSMWVHDNQGHYAELGHGLVKAIPYPLNVPGQTMKFQIFELRKETGS